MTAARLTGDPRLEPVARWVITARLELVTAAHLGGEGDSTVDMVVIRDRLTGRPLLTGASLGGALRGYLTDRLDGYLADEADPSVAAVFGGRRPVGVEAHDDEGSQSPLVVFDALGELTGGPTEIRDGVAIDPASGVAEDHKKFDFEVLPAGTVFGIRVELPILARDDEDRQLSVLVSALAGLADGEIALGARRSRGLGRLRAVGWGALRYDLSTPHGWLDWLTADDDVPHSIAHGPAEACSNAHDSLVLSPVGQSPPRVKVVVSADLIGELLVRSPATSADAPDVSHLRSSGRSVMPGTGMAGVLRHRALRIVREVGGGDAETKRTVDALFGPPVPAGKSSEHDHTARASRIRISECFVEGSARVRSSRIRIDRVTQGVADTALFDEEPLVAGHLELTLELRNPEPGEVGLLLLLVKDLLAGDLPIGGSASVGRGVLGGQAVLTRPDCPTTVALLVERDGTGRTEPADAVVEIDAEIANLEERLAMAGES